MLASDLLTTMGSPASVPRLSPRQHTKKHACESILFYTTTQRSGLIAMGLAVLLASGCAPETKMTYESVPSVPEASDLVASLEGRWQMSSVTTGQCPEGFGSPPFMGGTRWIGNGSTLTLSLIHI